MTRHEIREQIFLLLFRIEFNKADEMPQQLSMFFESESCPDEDFISASGASDEEKLYISGKYGNIMSKLEEIDGMINEKAVGWDTSRMGKVDLTVIRLALFEMLFDDDIPESVAINEAVELARKFGQEESAGFVNGILAKFTQDAKERPEVKLKTKKYAADELQNAVVVKPKKSEEKTKKTGKGYGATRRIARKEKAASNERVKSHK